MHSTYHTQVQSFSVRTSYYSNARCPSSCFCCCSCSFSPNCSRLTVPTNPTLFYGLRQSTLIQLPPSRRLIYHRGPICNVGQHCFGESCCVEQERVDRFVKRGVCKEDCCVKKRGGIGRVSESRSRMMMGRGPRGSYRCSSVLGDAEAMLSLLTEEVSEECLDVRGRKRGSVREGKVVQMHYDLDEKCEDCEDIVGLDCGMKGHLRREELVGFSRDGDRWLRRRESSSSCHTVSDSGEFESDRENQMSQGEFDGELSVKKEKDLRKTGGIVIREEGRQNSDVYRDQQLKSSTYDDLRVGNSSEKEWDCRKKSEKKLTEESAETESSKVSVKRRSQLSRVHESNSAKGSSSKKQLSYEKGESSSGMSSHVQSKSDARVETDNRASEYVESSTTHQQLVNDRNEVESTSGRHSTFNEEENVMVVAELAQETGCKYCEECGGVMQRNNAQADFQQHDELLVVQSQSQSPVIDHEQSCTSVQSSVTEASMVENRSESRFEMQEKSSNLRCEESKEHRVTHASTGELMMDQKSQHYAENSSRLRKQSETRIEFSTSFISKQEMKGLQQKESSCKVTKEVESKEESQTRLLASQVNSTNVEISNQSLSDQRIYSEQTHSRSEVKSMEKIGEKHGQINETNVQVGVQTKKQGHVVQTGFSGHSSGDSTVTQASITLVSPTGFEQDDEGEIRSSLQVSVVSPYDEPAGSSVSIDHERITETGTSVAFVQPESRSNLDSAKQMDSLQIVGEFDEMTSHEVSSSDTKMEKKLSPRNSKRQDEKHLLKGSSLSEKISLLKEDTRDSSERLFGGTKKSSDEMLGVKNHLPQESSGKKLSVSKPFENFDAKRTGRSLWSTIARIFRWESQSEMQTSTVKPGDPSPSSESVTTSPKNYTEKQQTSLPQKPTTSDQTQLDRNATRNQQVNLGVIGSVDSTGYVGLGASSSSNVLQSGLLLGVISIEANTESNITPKKPQSDPSLNLSINPSKQSKRSNTSEEIQEVSQIEGSASSVEEHKQHQVDVGQTGVEPKQGKLQQSDQVLQETFDKWENAYKLESEQQKIDEFFMREALLEARNAADSWEVPIGAVLVRNGKIIARGYNLVEELRDATAHAEIICIREGSSVLRTWRLSETTLYVTLEPCPMCAGAILQARIGTLVWGAPNKLLGADGSWIRLFPEGAEGEERPEVADKPAAPVHPFHPKMTIRRGVLQSECAEIMQQFFQLRRKKNKKHENKAENPNQSSRLPISHHPSKLLHKMHDFLQIMLCIKF